MIAGVLFLLFKQPAFMNSEHLIPAVLLCIRPYPYKKIMCVKSRGKWDPKN